METIALCVAIALVLASLLYLSGLGWVPGWFIRLALTRHTLSTTRIPGPRPIPNPITGELYCKRRPLELFNSCSSNTQGLNLTICSCRAHKHTCGGCCVQPVARPLPALFSMV
jgi:hypothetical protein